VHLTSTTNACLRFNVSSCRGIRLPPLLGSWNAGLYPAENDEHATVEGQDALVRQHAGLWTLGIRDLEEASLPSHLTAWRSQFPAGLLERLRRDDLDQLQVLFLLRHHPELEGLLAFPSCFRQHVAEWLQLLRLKGLAAAQLHVRELLSRPRRELFWYDADARPAPLDARKYGRLMLDFAACFPGRFADRLELLDHGKMRNYAPLLPAFLQSSRPFRKRLVTLQAFALALDRTYLRGQDLAPLFHRCLKTGEKLRPNTFVLTLERLDYQCQLQGKGGLKGLVKAAPNVRWLERQLRRMERRFKSRMARGVLPDAQADAADFPSPALPAVPWLTPIRTIGRLVFEGIYMQNCIARYQASLQGGEMAAYIMAWPERCTVLLEQSLPGWILREARTYANQPPRQATIDIILAWLEGCMPEGPFEPPYFYLCPQDRMPFAAYWTYLDAVQPPHPEDEFEPSGFDEATSLITQAMPDPSIQLHLPERIARWERLAMTDELLHRLRDADSFAAREGETVLQELMVYLHPDSPEVAACVPYCPDPGASLRFVRLADSASPAGARRSFSLGDLQRQQSLRDALSNLMDCSESGPEDE
jgi:hypothetical protein